MTWYEEDIKKLEQKFTKLNYIPEMAFYGSSTITLWDNLCSDFAKYKPVNLGFGGSTLEACVYYFRRVMKPYNPKYLVIYAGDNDLGDGKQPKLVLDFFETLCRLVSERFDNITSFYISIKPSPARWNINRQIKDTNEMIRQFIEKKQPHMQFINMYPFMLNENGKPDAGLFVEDGLHLNSKGYDLWKEKLLTHFSLNIHDA